MNYEIRQNENGKYEIVNLINGESSGPRYRKIEMAKKVAADMQAEDERMDAYENAHK